MISFICGSQTVGARHTQNTTMGTNEENRKKIDFISAHRRRVIQWIHRTKADEALRIDKNEILKYHLFLAMLQKCDPLVQPMKYICSRLNSHYNKSSDGIRNKKK